MKKILSFSVVLLAYTLGNAQNGTQTNKSTSISSTSINTKKEVRSTSKVDNPDTRLNNAKVVNLNKTTDRIDDSSRKQSKINNQNDNVQPLERK